MGWRCDKRYLTRTVGKKEGIIVISRNISHLPLNLA
jgi:hypothetical protein